MLEIVAFNSSQTVELLARHHPYRLLVGKATNNVKEAVYHQRLMTGSWMDHVLTVDKGLSVLVEEEMISEEHFHRLQVAAVKVEITLRSADLSRPVRERELVLEEDQILVICEKFVKMEYCLVLHGLKHARKHALLEPVLGLEVSLQGA